jgi:hypothetical protein
MDSSAAATTRQYNMKSRARKPTAGVAAATKPQPKNLQMNQSNSSAKQRNVPQKQSLDLINYTLQTNKSFKQTKQQQSALVHSRPSATKRLKVYQRLKKQTKLKDLRIVLTRKSMRSARQPRHQTQKKNTHSHTYTQLQKEKRTHTKIRSKKKTHL